MKRFVEMRAPGCFFLAALLVAGLLVYGHTAALYAADRASLIDAARNADKEALRALL